MHKLFKALWFVIYVVRSLVSFRAPNHFVLFAPQLLVIGFGRIDFSGFCIFFPMSRIEIFGGGKVKVGAGVQIGQYCHITCAASISIGSGVAIAGGAVITDISHGTGPVDVSPLKRPWKVSPVIIEDNCFIGYGAIILPGAHLSRGCVVGANAKVKGFYPPGTIIS